jgi:tetratricopeptide (TPR) repeat protein
MKKLFSYIIKLTRYSVIYYLLIAGLLFVTVDRKNLFNTRRLYLEGIVVNGAFEDDRDILLYFEYEAIKNPSDYLALAKLGVGYCNLGDYRQAEHCFRKALRLKPESKEVQRFLELALAGKRGEKPEPSRFTITYGE